MTAPDPLTVAVQLDPIERYRYALSLAVRHGYTDNPDAFASRLRSDLTTRDAIEADAAEFAETIASIRAANGPERVLAVDPSQGHGIPNQHRTYAERFNDIVFGHIN